MPTRPPLSSTSPVARICPPAAGAIILALVAAVPGLVRPATAQRAEAVSGEVWTDVVIVPAGALEVAAEAQKKQAQKRSPCTPVIEVEHDGRCWMPHVSRPPCPGGLVEAAGQCLIRVRMPDRPDTSVDP